MNKNTNERAQVSLLGEEIQTTDLQRNLQCFKTLFLTQIFWKHSLPQRGKIAVFPECIYYVPMTIDTKLKRWSVRLFQWSNEKFILYLKTLQTELLDHPGRFPSLSMLSVEVRKCTNFLQVCFINISNLKTRFVVNDQYIRLPSFILDQIYNVFGIYWTPAPVMFQGKQEIK